MSLNSFKIHATLCVQIQKRNATSTIHQHGEVNNLYRGELFVLIGAKMVFEKEEDDKNQKKGDCLPDPFATTS